MGDSKRVFTEISTTASPVTPASYESSALYRAAAQEEHKAKLNARGTEKWRLRAERNQKFTVEIENRAAGVAWGYNARTSTRNVPRSSPRKPAPLSLPWVRCFLFGAGCGRHCLVKISCWRPQLGAKTICWVRWRVHSHIPTRSKKKKKKKKKKTSVSCQLVQDMKWVPRSDSATPQKTNGKLCVFMGS